MEEPSKSTFELINELISVLSELLWPIITLIFVIMFKKEISSLLKRMKKGKIFGQEVEITEDLKRLETATSIASENIVEHSDYDEKIQRKRNDEILKESIKDPVIGIVRVAREIETEVLSIVGAMGLLPANGSKSLRNLLKILEDKNVIAESVIRSARIFWELRNRAVHGREVGDAKQIIQILDHGINLLETLEKVPRSKFIVYKTDITLYRDPDCLIVRDDVKGVLLETKSTEGVHTSFDLRPTTKNYYQVGDVVSWEWSFQNKWDSTFYKNPDNDVITKAFDSSAEFVGRPLRIL
jgi:uncharacterized protein YutE (UPF0331/DUF86 family)